MPTTCVFCQIVAGDIPASKVYESDEVLAFLDINPIEKGHTLVIAKRHYATLMDTPEAIVAQLGVGLRRVTVGLLATLAEGANILQSNGACAGQEVPHVHFHVVPRRNDGRPRSWVSGGVRYASAEERLGIAERLRAAVARQAGAVEHT